MSSSGDNSDTGGSRQVHADVPGFPFCDELLSRHRAKVLRPDEAVPPHGGSSADLRPTVYRYDRLLVPPGLRVGRGMIPGPVDEALSKIDLKFEDQPAPPAARLGDGVLVPPRVSYRLVPKDDPGEAPDGRPERPPDPVDAWQVLQFLRNDALKSAWDASLLSLDHLLFAATVSYITITGSPGSEGHGRTDRAPVIVPMDPPVRQAAMQGRRRPVVAVLDTGCGKHPWLPLADDNARGWFVKAEPPVELQWRDPEDTGSGLSPLGEIYTHSGHGTFISGIVRQLAPDAQVLMFPIMHSDGVVYESDLEYALTRILDRLDSGGEDTFVDVLSMSFGWYPEQEDSGALESTIADILRRLAERGVVIVAAAGNNANDRPMYPAAFSKRNIGAGQTQRPMVVSVGASNPNLTKTMFSDSGEWVKKHYPGVSILSTFPPFQGNLTPARMIAGAQDLDPDDFTSGWGVWSGTSFSTAIAAARAAAMVPDAAASAGVTATGTGADVALKRADLLVQRLLDDKWPRR